MRPLERINQRVGKRIELVNRRTLFTLTLVTLTLLWLLKPNTNLLVSLLEKTEDPTVAIAFIQVLRSDQSSPTLDLALAQQYQKLAQPQRGIESLSPLAKFDQTPEWLTAHQLYTQLLLNLSQTDAAARATLLSYLQQLPLTLPVSQKQQLADYALQLGEPALALAIRKTLPAQDPAELLALALQANATDEAARQATALYQLEPSQQTLLQLLPLLEQEQQGQLALRLATQHLQTAPCDAACLQYLIGLALRSNDVQQAAAFADRKAATSRDTADWLQASELFAATGEIAKATHYLELVSQQQPSQAVDRQLHQYYRWQQDTTAALRLSKRLLQQTQDQDTVRQAIADAMAESDLAALADFYTILARQTGLTPAEFDTFIDATDKAYGAAVTLQKLQQLYRLRPQQAGLAAQLARFYLFTGQPQQVTALWPQVANTEPLSTPQLNWFAQAFISVGQPETALQILHQYSTPETMSTAQLSSQLELARYTANLPLQRYYQQQLLLRTDNELDTFLAVETHSAMSSADLEFLWQLYQQTQALNILSAILNHASSTADDALFAKAAAMLQQYHATDNKPETQQLRIFVALQQQDYTLAKQQLQQILQAYPELTSEWRNAGWLALTTSDQSWLRQLYPQLQRQARSEANQLRLLAAMAERLGQFQQALYWQQLLAAHPEVAAADKLNFALLAERFGDLALAQQLRWQVVREHSTALRQDPNTELSYQSLVASLLAPAVAAAELLQQLQQQPSSQILNPLAAGTLRNNLAALQYWQQQLQQQGQAINDTLSLTLALAKQDKLAVRALAYGSVTLTPLERASALAEIGDRDAAWNLAERYANGQLSVAERAPLLRLAANLHPLRSHGWRATVTEHASWDFSRRELRYYQPYADSQWRLELQHEAGDTPGPLLTGYRNQSGHFSWLTSVQDNALQLQLNWLVRQRANQLQHGQQAVLSWDNAYRLSHSLRLRHQMPSEQSRNLYLLGHEDRLEWQPRWQFDRVHSLSGSLAVSRFATDFNESIGQQRQLQLQYSYQLLQTPNWRWYTQYDWQTNRLAATDFTALSNYTGNSYTALDFLTERYQRLAIGQQWARGQVGEPGPQQPHYRYFLDTAVGYNLVTDNVDYALSFGFGIRLLGNDELFIKSNWQSADPLGRESLSFSLGYFIDF